MYAWTYDSTLCIRSHTTISLHHHQTYMQIWIHQQFTITRHICNHQQHSQINLYIFVFTNTISTNQHMLNLLKISPRPTRSSFVILKIRKTFSSQTRDIRKLINLSKTSMFISKANSKQKCVKRTQNAKQKNWNWGNSPPKRISSLWRAEYPFCHHVARFGEWSCSPWRAKHALCHTFARCGE